MNPKDKRLIRDYVLKIYERNNPSKVKICSDGEVTVYLDPLPNFLHAGRKFVGWDTALLRDAIALNQIPEEVANG